MSQAFAERRPARIGVLSPAGKVVDHDRVLTWAHDDPNRSIRAFSNIGDSFVYESSLRILDYSDLVPVMVPEDAKQRAEHIEKLNQLDFIFLRGSNYINTSGKWDAVTEMLEETTVPIIAMGIGVQAPDNAEVFVNESTDRFLHLVADRSTTIGIRGAESERALRSLGIKNTRVFGCPTVFRHRQPEIHLRRVDADQIERLGLYAPAQHARPLDPAALPDADVGGSLQYDRSSAQVNSRRRRSTTQAAGLCRMRMTFFSVRSTR